MVTSKKYKYAKKTKRSRTRRQRHRRRQMRGGGLLDGSFIDMFKPRVKNAAYCQKQFDECNANIKSPDSEADSGSSGFLTTVKNFIGIEDSRGSVGRGDDGTTGFEMQELTDANYAAEQAAATGATVLSETEEQAAAAAVDANAAAAAEAQAAAAKAQAAADLQAAADTTSSLAPGLDVATLSPPPPASEYGLTGQPTAKVEETEDEKNARINNSMGVLIGGSRKKYKKRNANRSKKNKNRRNKKRTNKKN